MDDAVAVYVLQCQDGLGEVDPGHVQGEGAHVLQQRSHVASLNILHHHIEMVLWEVEIMSMSAIAHSNEYAANSWITFQLASSIRRCIHT